MAINGEPIGKGFDTTLQRQMEAFDRLPKSARAALADARANWAAEPYLNMLDSGELQVWELTRYIRDGDVYYLHKEAPRVWGDDYAAIVLNRKESK